MISRERERELDTAGHANGAVVFGFLLLLKKKKIKPKKISSFIFFFFLRLPRLFLGALGFSFLPFPFFSFRSLPLHEQVRFSFFVVFRVLFNAQAPAWLNWRDRFEAARSRRGKHGVFSFVDGGIEEKNKPEVQKRRLSLDVENPRPRLRKLPLAFFSNQSARMEYFLPYELIDLKRKGLLRSPGGESEFEEVVIVVPLDMLALKPFSLLVALSPFLLLLFLFS